MSLVLPILEYGASCWDPYRKGQIIALDHVQDEWLNLQSYERFGLGSFGAA